MRPALLEPSVLRSVDLDQLTPTVSAIARLIWARAAGFSILLQTRFHHPLAQRLAAGPDAMAFGQILTRQRRPEIRIMRADQRNDLIAKTSLCRRLLGRPRVSSLSSGGVSFLSGLYKSKSLIIYIMLSKRFD